MEQDTIKLLEQVNVGCEMAENSFHQLEHFGMKESLEKTIQKYRKKHKEIQQEAEKMLEEAGGTKKSPGTMAEAMSWITTEMKMMIRDDAGQIAKLMMDGCNMGIQKIGEKISQYPGASKEAVRLAEKLIQTEEDFMAEMKEFL